MLDVILVLSTRIYPDIGGVAKNVYSISKYLSKRQIRVINIASKPNKKFNKKNYRNDENFLIDYLPFRAPGHNSNIFKFLIFFILYFMFTFKKVIKIHKKYRIKLIHAHSPPPSGFVAYFISKILNIPYFYTYHGLDYPFPFILTLDTNIVAKSSKKTIAVSKMIKNFLKNRYKLKNIYLLPNFVDISNYYHIVSFEEKKKFIRKLDLNLLLNKDDFIISYIGYMFLPQKVAGMLDFLIAFSNFLAKFKDTKEKNQIKLLYIGDGKYSYRIENKISALNLHENVFFLGKRNDIRDILAISDFLALTSYVEGFPIVILEALASKVPCLASNTGEIKNIIGNAGFLIEPGNIDKIENHLNNYYNLSNPDRLNLMNIARNRIKKRYDVQIIGKKLLKLYTCKKDKITKICIFSFYGYSLFNRRSRVPFGGAEAQLYLLSKEFAKKENTKVYLITGDKDLKKRIETYQNIEIHISIPVERKFLNYPKAIINLIQTLIKINPDVIIQRAAGIPTALMAIYCKIFKKKFIYSIANLTDVIKNGEKGIKGKIYEYGLDNASIIIAQNRDQISHLKNWKKSIIEKTITIKNGYKIKKVYKVNKERILWVGRAEKFKRPELFFELAEKFPQEKFEMICPKFYNPNYWEELKIRARNYSNIDFVDFVPFNQIDKNFNRAKILISTSIYEGFPNTFIQALKNKTPVISLNVDPDNFLMKNKCGFNCRDDINKLEFYLEKLLDDDNLYEIYSNNAFEYVQKYHDIEKIATKWIDLIHNLIKTV